MANKSYHMRDVQRKLWEEVSVEMSCNVADVKNKWRGLRDTFRKEFTKSKKQRSGDGAESVVISKWPYFKILLFLSNVVERRKLHGNVTPPKESDNNSDPETESTKESADITYSQTIQESSHEISVTYTDTQQRSTSGANKGTSSSAVAIPMNKITLQRKPDTINRRKYAKTSETTSMDNKFLEIERATLQLLSQRENKEDSEYQFLMSLLPFLKAVPRNRQMMVRHQLQQVFLAEEQHTFGASYRPHEDIIISSPLPSPGSYTHTDSSSGSVYTDLLPNVSCQQLQSVQTYIADFRE